MAEETPNKIAAPVPEKDPQEKEDDMGKDLGPKLIFLAAGVVIGLVLYCVIFDCSCDECGDCAININDPAGGILVIERDSEGTRITKDGTPQDCEWDCRPVPGPKDGDGEPGTGDPGHFPGQPDGEPGDGGPEPDGTCQGDYEVTGFCGGECEVDGQIGVCEVTGPDECSCYVEGEPGGPELTECQQSQIEHGYCQDNCEIDGWPGYCAPDGDDCVCMPSETEPEPEPGPELTECQQSQIEHGYCQDNCEIDGWPGYCAPDGDDCVCMPSETEPEPEPGPEYVNCHADYLAFDICAGDCILPDQTPGNCYFDEHQESCYCAEPGYEPPQPEPGPETNTCQNNYDSSGFCGGDCSVNGQSGVCEWTGSACECYTEI
jgi:hypothetical protein